MSYEDKTVPPTSAPAAKKSIPEAALKKPRANIIAADSDIKPMARSAAAAKKATAKGEAIKRAFPKKVAKKKGNAVSSGTRGGPSKRTFPQYGLEDCYKLAHAIREFNAGNP